jgi:hypothetical protein
MVTQSNPGSEIFRIANAHTMLHQWHDPALKGTLQHCWMHSKKNVMPEIMWSQLQHHFTPGFESLWTMVFCRAGMILTILFNCMSIFFFVDFALTLTQDLNVRMCFQWVFIPWLQ